jgi:4-coumarate--CoA ligase
MTLINVLSAAVKVVFIPKFEEGLFLSCIENYQINCIFMVPPLMVFLAKHPLVDAYDLSSLKYLISGAAPLSKEVELAVMARYIFKTQTYDYSLFKLNVQK